ncbi:jasmonate-induced oxygenase 1-like [Rhododendron vialii]|uniref:jasmonate-induced oxygenase 1-like n=1 Tax=Rhododendron vialii TaxID=182163 RepID=UPI00265DD63F|nr:jasmonate-induced oxygenase 1-like [Rhododendron vialii]
MEAFERSSLLVPCVLELAKESLTTVPARYTRPDQDPQITSYSSLPDVPIINIEKLVSGDQMELKKLDSACKEWRFFQVLNNTTSCETNRVTAGAFLRFPAVLDYPQDCLDNKLKPEEMAGKPKSKLENRQSELHHSSHAQSQISWAPLMLIQRTPTLQVKR